MSHKFRRAFFAERGGSFLAVVCCRAERRRQSFQRERNALPYAGVHNRFRKLHRQRRIRRNLVGERVHARTQLVARHHRVDQAPALRDLRRDARAGENHLLGARNADQRGKSLRTAPARLRADLRFGERELGVVCRDA